MSVIRHALVRRTLAPASRVATGGLTSALLWLLVGVEGFFVIGLFASGGETTSFVNVWLSSSTQWIPVAIFWLVAWRTQFSRPEVWLAAAGVTLSALGDTYYSMAMDSDGYLAFPSPADAGYLLFYPLMVGALFALVRGQLANVRGMVLLESLLAMLGASTVLAVILDPLMHDALGSSGPLESMIALAYPLFDLLLLAVVVGIASVPTIDLGPRWWALVAGLGVFAAADITYALLEHTGTYVAGTPLDAAWAVGLGS